MMTRFLFVRPDAGAWVHLSRPVTTQWIDSSKFRACLEREFGPPADSLTDCRDWVGWREGWVLTDSSLWLFAAAGAGGIRGVSAVVSAAGTEWLPISTGPRGCVPGRPWPNWLDAAHGILAIVFFILPPVLFLLDATIPPPTFIAGWAAFAILYSVLVSTAARRRERATAVYREALARLDRMLLRVEEGADHGLSDPRC